MQVVLSFPTSDTGLLAWAQNIVTLVTPTPATYGLVAGDVTTFTALVTGYSTALAACDPGLRNKSAVVAKNAARTALKTGASLLINKVYASPTVTDSQKTALGVPPRRTPSPIPVPSSVPAITVKSVRGRVVSIKLSDTASSAKRGKPPGVSGASVFSFIGATAPDDLSLWKFEGNIGRATVDVSFPAGTAGGAQVWLTAFWFNGRKQSGLAADPVTTYLQSGGVSLAA
jgi:hypothetical protein